MRSNASIVAPLLERSRLLGRGGPRLLRLLCRCLFNGGLYTQRSRIARGAYAHVRTLHDVAVIHHPALLADPDAMPQVQSVCVCGVDHISLGIW